MREPAGADLGGETLGGYEYAAIAVVALLLAAWLAQQMAL